MNDQLFVDRAPLANQQADRYLIDELCNLLRTRFSPEQVGEVFRAYEMAAKAHSGQNRLSGEPYIFHPLAVARTLAEMKLDHRSVISALLHDVLEDTDTTREDIANAFGEEVAKLVDGVSKLTHLEFESRLEQQAANFRKMIMAMADDIRVVLIKLADRLHNMRTIGVLPPAKRRRIARETLDIYAPIANRLGIATLRHELEGLSFAALYPMRHRVLKEAVRKARGNRKENLQKIEVVVGARLNEDGIPAEVHGREKNVHSIYSKMQAKHSSFHEVFDVFAIRVVVRSIDDCYRALGVLHSLYKPVPGRFKDYVAIPKANGYQSLHTTLFGPNGWPIEVQIRTEEMHRFAESGVAAHWLYKSGQDVGSAHTRAREWLSGLLDMQQNADSSVDFLENVKVDLFPDEIYVFSPRGDIYELPRDATAVDFAYAIHSDIGHTCVAAKINRRLAPLSTPLETGQTVEVVTATGSRPSPLWLNFVVTAKARTAIRHFLKNLKQEEAVEFGRRLVNRALSRSNLNVDQIEPARIDALLQEFGYADSAALWADIGLGNRIATLVARRLLPEETGEETEQAPAEAGRNDRERPLAIKGTEGMVVTYGRCCFPIPGDRIYGFLSSGRGIVIHRMGCRNIADYRRRPDRWVPVEWAPDQNAEYTCRVQLQAIERRGVLAKVAAVIAEHDANIVNVKFEDRDGRSTLITFDLGVRDRQHLADVIRSLRNRSVVMRVRRSSH